MINQNQNYIESIITEFAHKTSLLLGYGKNIFNEKKSKVFFGGGGAVALRVKFKNFTGQGHYLRSKVLLCLEQGVLIFIF